MHALREKHHKVSLFVLLHITLRLRILCDVCHKESVSRLACNTGHTSFIRGRGWELGKEILRFKNGRVYFVSETFMGSQR